ncbi:hypothetical protein BG011_004835 [Mortierella polycephala]|uniref:Yeast cell wall synthesis Kre9/Knh1-like N-terminal domain-containing protein n=1 Tax=Mortierella polycephala TaxID=41804 RepID=A0A9P6PYT4_9FUNG|nr:hypothetical protein BG011_004835 [Mortierella polycephala]
MKTTTAFVSLFSTLSAFTSLTHGFVYPSTPITDTVWKPNTNVTISWTDDMQAPRLSSKPVFDIFLMTGSDDKQTKLATIAKGVKGGSTTSVDYLVPHVSPPGRSFEKQIDREQERDETEEDTAVIRLLEATWIIVNVTKNIAPLFLLIKNRSLLFLLLVYFLMFQTKDGEGMAWATRFTITDAKGNPGTLKPVIPPGGKTNPGGVGTIVEPLAPKVSAVAPTTPVKAIGDPDITLKDKKDNSAGIALGEKPQSDTDAMGTARNGAPGSMSSAMTACACAVLGFVALMAF